jgi:hypothetical protein
MKRIVFDRFFHMPPGHRLSRNISTGGYRTNFGRYSPFDIYHPNGCSMLFADLLASCDFKFSSEPLSEVALAEADILLIPNPDYPLYEGSAPYRLDAPDIDAMVNYLNRGGSVVLGINSFLSRSDFWEENFDLERLTPLFDRLGVKWDHDFMSDENRILPAKGCGFIVGYGQGGRVLGANLPMGAEPLLTFEGNVFGFTTKVGRGKLAVVGDAGLISNGLYHFPGFENAAFLLKLFDDMTPAWCAGPVKAFERFEFGHLSCGTSEQGITEGVFRSLRKHAAYAVDHHYRHLTYESQPANCSAAKAAAELPVKIEDAQGKTLVRGEFPFVGVSEGRGTASYSLELHVAETRSSMGVDFIISGTKVNESLSWNDIGADPEVFGPIGELERVNNVVQILAGTRADGSLRYYVMKEGQILYDKNLRNAHYGYDILLGSRNLVISPAAAPEEKRT